MDPRCVAAVRAAANGKPVSQAKLQKIESTIRQKMGDLAQQDMQRWRSLSTDQRYAEGVKAAMDDIVAAAARKEQLAMLQIMATERTEGRIKTNMTVGNLNRSEGLIRDIEHAGQAIDAIRNDAISGMTDLMDAVSSKDGTGLLRNLGMRIFDLDNPAMTVDVVREVFRMADGSTGNKAAQAGAKAWLDTIEALRLRFNAAGGDVGKLGYGYLSQAHDKMRVLEAGADGWAKAVLPLLDRKQYLTPEGRVMGDAEVLDLLRAAHETISTGGQNKTEPGTFRGAGAKANAGSERRVLHFANGDAWMAYMDQFGQGSLYDAMIGHIGGMARDVGLVERFGPNPEQQMKVQMDIAERADLKGAWKNRVNGVTPEGYWNVVSGKSGMAENAFISATGQNLRNVQTAAKLGGAVLSSTTDVGTIAASLHFNKLPYFQMLKNVGKQFDGETREFLRSHGVIGEALVSSLNRWTGDHMTHSLTGRVAGSVMKLSLMNAWTDGLRNAFSMTMMGGLAKMAKKPWAKLDEWDRYLLQRKGITEADWDVVNKAVPSKHQGGEYLTPEAIRQADVAAARPADIQRVRDSIAAQTAELSQRNAQDQAWINGRIDKFDEARDALNRQVKARAAKRGAKAQEAAGPLLERMALLDAQRESAKLQADMEADFNRFVTQDEVRAFLNAVEDGASADKTDVGQAKPEVRRGMESAEAIGRRYGVKKGELERRMVELQNRIGELDKTAKRETDADAKAAQAKVDEMLKELKAFAERSQDRQKRRAAVIDRLQREEGTRVQAEAERIRNEVATKILAFTMDEAQFAVVNPDIATRAIVTGGGMPSGTMRGEMLRTFTQFKSFPIAMMTRHWRRILETPQGLEGAPLGFGAQSEAGAVGNRMALMAAMGVTLTMLGAVVLQNKALVTGKDPYDMTEPRFWMRAFGQGGGAGYLGDLIFKDPTEQHGNSTEQAVGAILGPAAGSVAGLAGDLIVTNAWEAAKGKDTKAAAETLRWANAQLPGQSLWWTRGLWERAFLHNAQEALNPGYLARMKQRARRDWDQGFWWEPGEVVPERAPEFEKAVGQ